MGHQARSVSSQSPECSILVSCTLCICALPLTFCICITGDVLFFKWLSFHSKVIKDCATCWTDLQLKQCFFYFIKKRRRHIKFKLLARRCHFYASLVVASLLSGDVFLFSPKHTIETLGYFAVGGQINSWICIMELYNSSFNKDSGHFWGDVSLVLS